MAVRYCRQLRLGAWRSDLSGRRLSEQRHWTAEFENRDPHGVSRTQDVDRLVVAGPEGARQTGAVIVGKSGCHPRIYVDKEVVESVRAGFGVGQLTDCRGGAWEQSAPG